MTKSECYSQICTCEAAIEEDRRKIRELEEKIAVYEQTYGRVERGQENRGDFCAGHSRKINWTKESFPRVRYIDCYVRDMTEYLQGEEYVKANSSFEDAKDTLQRKKQNASDKVDELYEDIRQRQNRISQLQDEIREIERREAEERRREEERRRQEGSRKRSMAAAAGGRR